MNAESAKKNAGGPKGERSAVWLFMTLFPLAYFLGWSLLFLLPLSFYVYKHVTLHGLYAITV
ncbi:hypothetical protein Geob_3859 [Geotalea daltonii FRC-32]|uniref:Uncharacterized protein n=1 Tax=Geotalea daltonii (strain DSM 22248 / JCM 15807 / FRC-32) TaxID=316067 RepID=A0A068F6B3_GEODF|nr:hypothetical protein Geob_3859 [Geotalea daltonii FRC-32]